MSERLSPNPSEIRPLKPQDLIDDNHSEKTLYRIENWYEMRAFGRLTLVANCADARAKVIPYTNYDYIIELPTIATAGSTGPFDYLLRHHGNSQILVLEHHDGTTMREGRMPKGCGGLMAKGQSKEIDETEHGIAENNDRTEHGIAEYIAKNVQSEDVIAQALKTSYRIALHTDKPILAGTVDHTTGEFCAFAYITDRGRNTKTAFFQAYLENPNELYAEGRIPAFEAHDIPKPYQDLFMANIDKVKEIKETDPNFMENQKVQNPNTVILTSSSVPPSLRYPEHFGRPNTSFTLALPISKVHEQPWLDPQNFFESIHQAQYPIEKSANSQNDNEDFFKTRTLIVETPSMDLSEMIARELTEHSWMRQWLIEKDGRIILAQVNKGKTEGMLKFNN